MEDARQAVPTFSTLAIFSLIVAILAWTLLPVMGTRLPGWSFMTMPLTGSVVASLCAWLAQRQIRASQGSLRGAGLAKAARIMAFTQYFLAALVLAFVCIQVFLVTHSSTL